MPSTPNACHRFRLAAVIAARGPAPLGQRMVLHFLYEPGLIFNNSAWDFAIANGETAVIVIFRAGDGSLSIVPANQFEGELADRPRDRPLRRIAEGTPLPSQLTDSGAPFRLLCS